MAATAGPGLSDEQLAEVLELLPDSDSVELKVTSPESEQYETATALDLDPLNGQLRQIYFFDTPDLALNKAGVVVRARRVQGRGGDTVVKLRPVVPAEMPKRLRKDPGFVVELDAMPGGFVCSGTLKRSVPSADVRHAGFGTLPVSELFDKDQRKFLAEHSPAGVSPDDLSVMGPILVLKLKIKPKQLKRRLVAEVWLFPDNSRVLELSTKCKPDDAFRVAAETRAFLSQRGVDLSAEQSTKTVKALKTLSARLPA